MKKCVSDLKTFAFKEFKIAAAKKFLQFFFICSLCLNVFIRPVSKVQCSNFLDFWNPWGKVMRRNGLRFENFSQKGCESAVQYFIYFFPGKFCLTCRIFSVSVLLSALVERFSVSHIRDFPPSFLSPFFSSHYFFYKKSSGAS